MDRYIFCAIFEYGEDGYSVSFPDLPGCYTCGNTLEEAYKNAKEALELHLYGMEEDNEKIPKPIDPYKIEINSSNSFTTLIEVYMPLVRYEMANKSIKKTLTIPKWLNEVSKEYNINFSQVLQSALQQHLGLLDKSELTKFKTK